MFQASTALFITPFTYRVSSLLCPDLVLAPTPRFPLTEFYGPMATRVVSGHDADEVERSAALGVGIRSF